MKKNIDYTKPSTYRRFVKGDVILYDEVGQQYNMFGSVDYTIKPYTRTGIMLINSFDYDADYAARCSVGRSAIGLKASTIYGNFAPAGKKYRKAKLHHIRKFIRDLTKDERTYRIYAEEIEYLKTLIETK